MPTGKTWTYLSCHLQFAGAIAVVASGKPIHELYETYLYQPFNMTKTTWTPTLNPSIAAGEHCPCLPVAGAAASELCVHVGITTTARDFENLLHRLLTYKAPICMYRRHTYSQAPPVAPGAPKAHSGSDGD